MLAAKNLQMEYETSLKGVTGEAVALKNIDIGGKLHGLLLSMSMRQHYRNETGKNLEIVYTFPVAWGATLLDMNVDIAGKRFAAVVLEKKEAAEKYEKAIDEGDTPVMVEQSAPGLYTANLGNIKDKEEITIEVRYAQCLRFEQGQIRLRAPAVIAPRYGDAHAPGALAPHESADVSLAAQYPLTLKIELLGTVSKAQISSPSHKISSRATETGISVFLKSNAFMDRDFILNLDGLEGQSFAVSAPDGGNHMLLASFCPALASGNDPLCLKILVDCSGSMHGDSIESAQQALRRILQELQEKDFISYSRFGSTVAHDLKQLQICSPQTLQQLHAAIAATGADMGGTEMEGALLSVFKDIAAPSQVKTAAPMVLLITDGDVWDAQGIIKASLASEHRLFVVGVSSAPAESLLRDMAEKTGGACELISPHEDMAAAIVRMFHRMRGAKTLDLQVDWGAATLWRSPLPRHIYDGETIHLFASLKKIPAQGPKLIWNTGGQRHRLQMESISQTDNKDVSRLGGARRMASAASPRKALALALQYQLVSKYSNLFLVHLREGQDKAAVLPELQQIPQMLAAGHGGMNTVKETARMPMLDMDMSCAMMDDSPSKHKKNRVKLPKPAILGSGNALPSKGATAVSPRQLLEYCNNLAKTLADFAPLARGITALAGKGTLAALVEEQARQKGLTSVQVWAIALDWLLEQLRDKFTPSRQAQRLLRAQLRELDNVLAAEVKKILTVEFPAPSLDAWSGETCAANCPLP